MKFSCDCSVGFGQLRRSYTVSRCAGSNLTIYTTYLPTKNIDLITFTTGE